MSGTSGTEEQTLQRIETLSRSSGGRFIVFEGIDGAGKSTLMADVEAELSPSHDVVTTAEPSDSWIGDCVRQANRSDVSPFTEAMLFVADRTEHTRRIREWVDRGKVVLCDRYYGSTMAYQSVVLDRMMGADSMDWLWSLNEPVVTIPDLTVLLDLPAKTSLERVNRTRETVSKFERLGYLEEVRNAYLHLAKRDRSYVLVDATRPQRSVRREALTLVQACVCSVRGGI